MKLPSRSPAGAILNKSPARVRARLGTLGTLAAALMLSATHAAPSVANDDGASDGAACATLLAARTSSEANESAATANCSPSADPETLIVMAGRLPQPADKLGSSVTLLDGDWLARRQGALLGELLRAVPGVSVSRSGGVGAITQVRMRGGESNHVLVFIDEVRANDPAQNGEFNFANLLAAGVESVEIIRGPQSSLWGSDALGRNQHRYSTGGSGPWRRSVGGGRQRRLAALRR